MKPEECVTRRVNRLPKHITTRDSQACFCRDHLNKPSHLFMGAGLTLKSDSIFVLLIADWSLRMNCSIGSPHIRNGLFGPSSL